MMSTTRVAAILSLSCAVALASLLPHRLYAEIVVTSLGPVVENFNSLPTTNQIDVYPHGGAHVAVSGTVFDAAKYSGDPAGGAGDLFADNGGLGTQGLYSFGSAGPPVSTERALGSVASAGVKMAFGFVLRNNLPAGTITEITVSFTQEDWRRGAGSTVTHIVPATWSTSDVVTPPTTTNYLTTTSGYTAVTDLNLALLGGTVGALDGNLATNQHARSFTFTSLDLSPGDRFFLRWQDPDETGSDAGLALDNMTISFTAVGVPEPGAFLFGMLACGVAGCMVAGRKLLARRVPSGQVGENV